jgi:protein phosphatase 1 regulatory subunit 11
MREHRPSAQPPMEPNQARLINQSRRNNEDVHEHSRLHCSPLPSTQCRFLARNALATTRTALSTRPHRPLHSNPRHPTSATLLKPSLEHSIAGSTKSSFNMTTPRNPPSTATATTVQVQPVLRLSAPSGTLRLRAEPAEARHIQWADDVVDNEGMGKKSSKGMPALPCSSCAILSTIVCCIYHKPRAAGESSDESSSDSSSDSDSDSEPDNSRAQPASGRRGGQPRGRRPHGHDHDHDHHGHEHNHGEGPSEKPKPRRRPHRKPSPNAYEKMPTRK